jgi:hypothetical protein
MTSAYLTALGSSLPPGLIPSVEQSNTTQRDLRARVLAIPPTTTGGSSIPPNPPSLSSPQTAQDLSETSRAAAAKQAEQIAELSRVDTEVKLREAKAKLAQGDESKWLAILSLLIPVMLNGGKVNAEQVNWWKEMVPQLGAILKN